MQKMWLKLGVMTVLSFISMYFLMYSMVNSFSDLYLSVNQAYMAGSMTAAMVAIELLVMGGMYKNALVRNVLIGFSVLMVAVFVMCTRYQAAIYDRDFIRSMVPHHSGAILMCANENLSDTELLKLCREIIDGQQKEIDQMNEIKARLDN